MCISKIAWRGCTSLDLESRNIYLEQVVLVTLSVLRLSVTCTFRLHPASMFYLLGYNYRGIHLMQLLYDE